MDLFGVDYLFENALEYIREMQYKNYVTDALKALVEITIKVNGGEISIPSYHEIVNPKQIKRESAKTADEIVDEIISNTGIKLI